VARREFRPYAADPMEVATCNLFQELAAYLVYRSWSRQVRDPFLSEMLAQFAKDELRHFKFYQALVAEHVREEPAFRKTIMKVFLKATTPFNQVSDGIGDVLEHFRAGVFYFRKAEMEYFLAQVEFLLGERFESFFAWLFAGQIEPCRACGREVFRCECEDFEQREPAAPATPRRAAAG
jgi:rubrerythrin